MLTPCHKLLLQSTLVVALLVTALSGTPTPVRQIREENEPSTIHSRLLFGLHDYSAYLFLLQTIDCATNVDMAIQNPDNDLKAIINDTCDLLSFYDMLNAVDESKGKDLRKILEQITVDACNWTKLIVNTTNSATFSQSGEENCLGFLRKQCVAQHAKEGWLKSKLESSKNNIRQVGLDYGIAIGNQAVPWINSLSCV